MKPEGKGKYSCISKCIFKGAEEAGNTVRIFRLGKMEIHGCKGCFGGKNEEEYPCVQKDDMQQIYQPVKEADVVVMASPLYYWNMSGQLRTAVDRLLHLKKEIKITFAAISHLHF